MERQPPEDELAGDRLLRGRGGTHGATDSRAIPCLGTHRVADKAYTAIRPYWNTDLSLNGFQLPLKPAAVTSWSTGSAQALMSWTFIPAPQP